MVNGVEYAEEIEREYGTCLIAVGIGKNTVPHVEELPLENTVEIWVKDSECSRFMAPSTEYMVCYRERSDVV